MALSREVKVKAGSGHLYPEARLGGWEPAAVLARRVADRILARQGYAALLHGRVLPESHFEFRGGPPEHQRPGGRVSRLGDQKR
jgi:hypothetical protein